MQQKEEKGSLLTRRKFIESEVDIAEMIVIDNGTQSVKIGRSGQDYPSVIIPTVAGIPRVQSQNDAAPAKRVYFGKELQAVSQTKKYSVQFCNPVEESHITQSHFDDMIQLWGYVLNDLLGVDPTTTSLLLVDSPLNSKQYRAKLIEMAFQRLKAASVLVLSSSVASLMSVGATVGLVTELGHGTTTCVPVYQGFALPHALQRSNVAGLYITKAMEQQLKNNNIQVHSKDPLDYHGIIARIKQQCSRVALDYTKQMRNDQRTLEERVFQLPDGTVVQLNKNTVYTPAQSLFQGDRPLPVMVAASLQRCTEQLKTEFLKNTIFCGGTSLLRGLEERLKKELAPLGAELNFDWQRRHSAWIGASMLGSLSTFQQLAITNKEISHSEVLKRIF